MVGLCQTNVWEKEGVIYTPINIIKDGVALSGTNLANVVNDHFLSINDDLPPLDLGSLPAYLPAPQPVPIITPIESAWGSVHGGVPQGTKLGPILFLVMINDLELKSPQTSASHWKYVDDLSLSESLSIRDQSTLQSDLDEIQQWAEQNDMRLNVKKCKEMVISYLRQSPNIVSLHINGNPLSIVSSFKVLGVTFNDHLKWNDNVLTLS
ncbi:Hypothetical predicted protein [Paramuricea clavata]|uniref:Uncharacterized protein n=1 Tax=Paramuricea clavata TaxID=317549 RepID=A0A6S7FVW3_PARCT|nr:Hypothetical predicted protein [Paramuricea clavata]